MQFLKDVEDLDVGQIDLFQRVLANFLLTYHMGAVLVFDDVVSLLHVLRSHCNGQRIKIGLSNDREILIVVFLDSRDYLVLLSEDLHTPVVHLFS